MESAAQPPGTIRDWVRSKDLERLVCWAGRRCGASAEELDDILQDVRLAILRQPPETVAGRSWVVRVALNKATDSVRARARGRRVPNSLQRRPSGSDEELGRLLAARASQLPTRLSDFYDLRYRQGLTERELAVRLGLCRASVRLLDLKVRRLLDRPRKRNPRPTAPPAANTAPRAGTAGGTCRAASRR